MTPFLNTLALVVNKKVTKEADLLVTLLTPRHGKITALAKNAQTITSSRLGCLQLGNIVKVHLYKKNDFFWLSQGQTITPFLKNSKNLSQINLLFYLLEIINQVIADRQHLDQVFETCSQIIQAINRNQAAAYLKNEIKLISLLGFGLPDSISLAFAQKNYPQTQKAIQIHLETILDHPLRSPRLFN